MCCAAWCHVPVGPQRKMLDVVLKQLKENEAVVLKRMRAVYFLVMHYMSFRIYRAYIMEQAECDAYADCPDGDRPGSIDCPFANYTSNQASITQLM